MSSETVSIMRMSAGRNHIANDMTGLAKLEANAIAGAEDAT